MRTPPPSILVVLAAIGFVVLSLTPRGLALCIGGGHDITDLIAGWCDEHRGHVHGSPDAHQECADHGHVHQEEAATCGDHAHEEHAQPCADIPLGLDECRLGEKALASKPLMPAVAFLPIGWAEVLWQSPRALITRALDHFSGNGPPRELQRRLRAVILLI